MMEKKMAMKISPNDVSGIIQAIDKYFYPTFLIVLMIIIYDTVDYVYGTGMMMMMTNGHQHHGIFFPVLFLTVVTNLQSNKTTVTRTTTVACKDDKGARTAWHHYHSHSNTIIIVVHYDDGRGSRQVWFVLFFCFTLLYSCLFIYIKQTSTCTTNITIIVIIVHNNLRHRLCIWPVTSTTIARSNNKGLCLSFFFTILNLIYLYVQGTTVLVHFFSMCRLLSSFMIWLHMACHHHDSMQQRHRGLRPTRLEPPGRLFFFFLVY